MSRIALLVVLFFLLSHPLLAREHRVVAGDTVTRIAQKHRVDPNALMHLNSIADPAELQIGDILEIPQETGKDVRKTVTVKPGDTVAGIARKYRVSQSDLRGLNELKSGALLRVGRLLVIPRGPGDNRPHDAASAGSEKASGASPQPGMEWAGGVKGLVMSGKPVAGGVAHVVVERQTLAMIARAYRTTEAALARANKLARKGRLAVGQEIFIAGPDVPVPVRTADYRPHPVQFIRIKHTQRMKLVLTTSTGRVNAKSRVALARLLGYRSVHPRLVELFQQIAERFPGRAIEIISGYRRHQPRKGKKPGPHSRGLAVDFRLQGVTNEELYGYIRAFDRVGAGYYPNSLHVHLDVREKKYLWTDISGRGQKAVYVRPEDPRYFRGGVSAGECTSPPPEDVGDDHDDEEESD